MQLSASTLQSLQQAGQAIHDSRERLKAEVARHTERLVSAMASQPLAPGVDSAFAQVKQVARLHQELQALEDQLVTIYQAAEQIKGEEIQVIEALPHRRSRVESAMSTAEDARLVAHPGPRKSGKAPPPKETQMRGASKRLGGRVSANDEKVFKHKGATLSQSQIAREAGIPVGSIVASIKRLLEVRRVIQVERGMYQMT
jgi:hypothetical protein